MLNCDGIFVEEKALQSVISYMLESFRVNSN